jgi:hypothetical protein
MRSVLLGGALLAAAAAVWAAGPYAEAVQVCTFADPRIAESSGIASSSRSDDYFFTHNDSGDNARLYAVSRTGQTLALIRVTGAQALDWEDMARGTDETGQPVLFAGDIGDNAGKRPRVVVYRIPEPEIDPTRQGATLESAPATRFELEYPDGPRDAESLLWQPGADRLLLVSKTLTGTSSVYAAPAALKADAPNRLELLGSVNIAMLPHSAKGFRDHAFRLMATGGAVSPDGTRLVVRTYTDAYEWHIKNGDVKAAIKAKPLHIALPQTRQGEAITYTRDGAALLISSEGANGPVHELKRRD